jgi:plastocyanin
MNARSAGALIGAAAVALALPSAASAATKTVQVGPFGKAQAAFQAATGDANQFFRKTVTIHKGDKVKWVVNGFHTITFAPKGEEPGLVVPDPATPIAGVNDAAGNPFWFNGNPTLGFNPLVALKQGGRKYSPTELLNSGLPLAAGPPPPYTLRFKKKGTFNYFCVVHPGMAARVHVVGASAKVPSAAKDKKAARREQKATLQKVQRLTTGLGTEDLQLTIQAGNDKVAGATVFKYFPSNPTFKVGDTVTLQMAPSSTEVHTFTFGPSNGQDQYNDQLAASLIGQSIDPRGGYPSEQPGPILPSVTTGMHGNGFYNSGFLDNAEASPLPSSTKVTFGEAGTYHLLCLIHPFMTSTVTVTP